MIICFFFIQYTQTRDTKGLKELIFFFVGLFVIFKTEVR